MAMVYFDTNVFHNLRDALAGKQLPDDVRAKIVLSPISAIETLSQLTIRNADEILASIHSMRTWLPDRAGVLDWPDTFIASAVFGNRLDDGFFERISNAVNACFVAESAEALREPAVALKGLLDKAKARQAEVSQQFLEKYRKNPVGPDELRTAFAHGVANRVRVKPGQKPEREVVGALSAYFEYQNRILSKATANKNYNFLKHQNDALDAEQLVYLADPGLHFLTGDTGFQEVKESEQRARIHIVEPGQLNDPTEATNLLTQLG